MIKLTRGFSLFELIVVLVVIGVLAASGLRYYDQAIKQSRIVAMELMANRFVQVVAGVRAHWYLNQRRLQQVSLESTQPSQPAQSSISSAELDNTVLYLTRQGWPASTSNSTEAQDNRQTVQECWQLWRAMLQNPPSATLAGEHQSGQRRYHISAIDGAICRYELISYDSERYYFDYHTHTGQVLVQIPDKQLDTISPP